MKSEIYSPDLYDGIKNNTNGCLVISEGVSDIGYRPFRNKANIKKILLPSTYYYQISYRPEKKYVNDFSELQNLNELIVSDQNPKLTCEDGVLYNKDKTILYFYPCGKKDKVFKIPDSVKIIINGAFYKPSYLEEVIFPTNFHVDKKNGFNPDIFIECNNLSKVTVMEDHNFLTSVDGVLYDENRQRLLFYPENKSEKKFFIPDSVEDIEIRSLGTCPHLEDIVLPAKFTSDVCLEKLPHLFVNCLSLNHISVSEHNKKISSKENVIYDGNESILYYYLPSKVDSTFQVEPNVRMIAPYAFRNADKIKHVILPEYMSEIGKEAFRNCKTLRKIVMPKSLINIDEYAFAGCIRLSGIELPKNLMKIDDGLFYNCTDLSTIEIPVSVMEIGELAFAYCENLLKIDIPKTVKNIKSQAFYSCSNLKEVIWQYDTTACSSKAFNRCSRMEKIIIPEVMPKLNNTELYIERDSTMVIESFTIKKSEKSRIKDFNKLLGLNLIDGDIVKIPLFIMDSFKQICARETAYFIIFHQTKFMEIYVNAILKNMEILFDDLMRNAVQIFIFCKTTDNNLYKFLDFIYKYKESISVEMFIPLYHMAEEKKNEKALTIFRSDPYFTDVIKDNSISMDSEEEHPIEGYVSKNNWYSSSAKELQKEVFSNVYYSDQQKIVSKEALIFVLASYMEQNKTNTSSNYINDYIYLSFRKSDKADNVVESFDQATFSQALDNFLKLEDALEFQNKLIPYCRFANADQVKTIIKMINEWEKYSQYKMKGHNAAKIARSALLLNDERESMIYADKNKALSLYADIRNTDEYEILDTFLSDLGFNKLGIKSYDIGGNIILVSLNLDFSFKIYDTKNHLYKSSFPKKSSDVEKYKTSYQDFMEMKKNTRKIVKNRVNALKDDYISGNHRNTIIWIKSYIDNPILNIIARTIIWKHEVDYDIKYFIISKDGPITSSGLLYSLKPIGKIAVAHPAEMKNDERMNWQKLITDTNIVQPFQQIWEPVMPKINDKNRYNGFQLPIFYVLELLKEGFTISGDSKNGMKISKGLWFNISFYCVNPTSYATWKGIRKDELVELGQFETQYEILYNNPRLLNHISYSIEYMIAKLKVQNDDPSITEDNSWFNMAQTKKLLNLAIQYNSKKCITTLQNFMSTHFN